MVRGAVTFHVHVAARLVQGRTPPNCAGTEGQPQSSHKPVRSARNAETRARAIRTHRQPANAAELPKLPKYFPGNALEQILRGDVYRTSLVYLFRLRKDRQRIATRPGGRRVRNRLDQRRSGAKSAQPYEETMCQDAAKINLAGQDRPVSGR
uniref:(northern house mosquito) hypothetical protein n=2 Tax=Culex pipiens TaxID=7175 RepID=A0A8D8INX2_CULPI